MARYKKRRKGSPFLFEKGAEWRALVLSPVRPAKSSRGVAFLMTEWRSKGRNGGKNGGIHAESVILDGGMAERNRQSRWRGVWGGGGHRIFRGNCFFSHPRYPFFAGKHVSSRRFVSAAWFVTSRLSTFTIYPFRAEGREILFPSPFFGRDCQLCRSPPITRFSAVLCGSGKQSLFWGFVFREFTCLSRR